MVWLAALMNASWVFLLFMPAKDGRHFPWGTEEGPRESLWEHILQRQAAQVAHSGLAIPTSVFLVLRIGAAAAGALALGALLGPVSFVCGGIAGWIAVQEWIKTKQERRLLEFADQFREVLQSIANSLRAGRAMQQALRQAYADLTRIPGRESGMMARELALMLDQLNVNVPVDDVIDGLVVRVPLEEVRLFADAIRICRLRGGNLVAVLQTLIRLNVDRFQVRQEVRVQTSEKRMEGSIISAMPLVTLLLLAFVSPDYMAPLTRTVLGQAFIGAGLLAVLIAFVVTRNITRIEV